MKQTMHYMDVTINQLLGNDNHLKTTEIAYAHYNSAMKELAELERLAEIGRAVEFFADKTDEHGESYHVPYIEDGNTYVTAVCHSEIQGIVKAYRERSGL